MASREPARNAGTAASRIPISSPSPDRIPNPQTRLLRLRKAGFRGAVIPARRVSPLFSSPRSPPDSFIFPIVDENSPRTAEKRMLYGEDRPPSPVNILQEIQNSTRQNRHSPKLELGEIFRENPVDENAIESPSGKSWYIPGHASCSPSPSNAVGPRVSKLRENSRAAKSPSALSPSMAKQVKGRKRDRVNVRSPSSESAMYIEHLESQLAAVNAKLDSMMSPTVNKARAAKLRALSNESRLLRQEVSTWEASFEQRVRDQI